MTEKRSVSLAGHRTSVALEPEFWSAVDRLALKRGQSLAGFVAYVDRNRKGKNLASALRLTVLQELERRIETLDDAAVEAPVRDVRPAMHASRAYT
ncbi:MAG TPA: ribbon-helix-helix domain-containing protein [Methylomirabilota bacterium]|nr:ribbon-helix-helix domain-containing protein [Methylomirabilota bacterium]